MIDITPYQERLEWLKEWIAAKIDGVLPYTMMTVTMETYMTYPPEELMRIYQQTGVLYFREPSISSNTRQPSFDEYCADKQRIK